MNDIKYDLIVCGAGPAGSSAAIFAAEKGLKVLIIDKSSFPREKPCGGGMPHSVMNYFPKLSWDDVIEQKVTFMSHSHNFSDSQKHSFSKSGSDDSIIMVSRKKFDLELLDYSKKSGVKFLHKTTIETIDESNNILKLFLRSSDGTTRILNSDFLIIADGASGNTRKIAGFSDTYPLAVALEFDFPVDWRAANFSSDTLFLDYSLQSGYLWAFPKKEAVNIGGGIFLPFLPGNVNKCECKKLINNSIQKYLSFFKSKGIFSLISDTCTKSETLTTPEGDFKYHAWMLPLYDKYRKLNNKSGRIILCGDSAGLINPFFGDGLLNSIKSSSIAVHSILETNSCKYSDAIYEALGKTMCSSFRLASIFYRWPEFFFKHFVTRHSATEVAYKMLSGTMNSEVIIEKIKRKYGRFLPGFSSF
ncbi:MAG: NAD(P)/FAD-dependent oxidoreductase [Candidatus Riflebacteria bacterium]|nr:NAD(P)/FAD-dependent oxidoreductase [Candidatus Riflebacteria bacterium]